jgi:hypothetical protein
VQHRASYLCQSRRKPLDPDEVPEPEDPPLYYGEKTSTDTYIVSKSSKDEQKLGGGGEFVCQTHRDQRSGVFIAYPLASHDNLNITETLTHFNPKPPQDVVVCVKGDNAGETLKALSVLAGGTTPALPTSGLTTQYMSAIPAHGRSC